MSDEFLERMRESVLFNKCSTSAMSYHNPNTCRFCERRKWIAIIDNREKEYKNVAENLGDALSSNITLCEQLYQIKEEAKRLLEPISLMDVSLDNSESRKRDRKVLKFLEKLSEEER